jgi:twitching motility protein PilT
MVMTPAISNLIREGKTHMIYGAIDTGAKYGMIPMDKALSELVRQGLIDIEEALTRAHNVEGLKILCGVGGRSTAKAM